MGLCLGGMPTLSFLVPLQIRILSVRFNPFLSRDDDEHFSLAIVLALEFFVNPGGLAMLRAVMRPYFAC